MECIACIALHLVYCLLLIKSCNGLEEIGCKEKFQPTKLNCDGMYSKLQTAKWIDLPTELQNEYTGCGLIPVEHMYIVGDNGTHFVYDNKDFDYYIQHAEKLVANRNYRQQKLSISQLWIFQMMLKLDFHQTHVAIIGSSSPFYESLLISLGVSKVTVFEYNELTYEHEKIYVEKERINNNKHLVPTFDFIISLSSIDHDGLGRYSDEICPSMDLHTMAQFKKMLSRNGKLILTVPIGMDLLIWNLMRIYGPVRFPLLLSGWKIIDSIGFDEKKMKMNFGGENNFRKSYEPVFVLQPEEESYNKDIDTTAAGTRLMEDEL